jgi:MoCo/4Fe-4S cofactor protein with predicted Tat translocation signal
VKNKMSFEHTNSHDQDSGHPLAHTPPVQSANNSDSMAAEGPELTLNVPNKYWMSLEQFNGDPDFVKRAENEFKISPFAPDDAEDGFARRDFLKLMGASIAMAGATGCIRRPSQNIIPYVKAPKEIIPGEAAYYASTWYDGSQVCGVIVKTLEGRPIKLEGNADFPINFGGLPARAHAEVLSLYDPDRLKTPKRNLLNKNRDNRETVAATFDAADTAISAQLKKGGVAVLLGSQPASISGANLLSEFAKVYGAGIYQLQDPSVQALRSAQKKSYGTAATPRYNLLKSRFTVTIDADILGTWLNPAKISAALSHLRV